MKTRKPAVLLALLAVLALTALSMTACDPNTGDLAPKASDFNIGNLNQTVGSVSAVTITPKADKSTGARTIYYAGTGGTTYAKSTTLPTAAGTYAVTFDVAAIEGWTAATSLFAGTLSITAVNTVATPIPSPLGGTYNTVQSVTLTTSTAGATIYYTLDGTNPTTSSTQYTGPINITATATLKAIAVKSEMTDSAIFTASYTINTNVAALTTVEAVTTYLGTQVANTAANPIFLPVAFNLGSMNNSDSNWRQLLTALNTAGKYVNLDLSACTLLDDGTVFGNNGGFSSYNTSQAAGLNKIVSITLPDTATSIAFMVLEYCTSLSSITLPTGITSISVGAFKGCTSLASITLPANVSIGTDTFAGCANLSFTLTGSGSLSVLESGKILVRNGTELVAYPSASGSVTLPAGITSIRDYAFYGCTGLTSITLPVNTSIGGSAFAGCTSLSFTLSGGTGSLSVLESGKILVKNNTELVAYPSASGNITTLSNDITAIKEGAFEGASLSSITLPTSLTSIEYASFRDCTNLASITLPSSLTSIGDGAFRGCTSLSSITLPAGLTSIGTNSFLGTGQNLTVICNAITPPTLGLYAFSTYSLTAIKVPATSVDAYKAATNWSAYADKISAIE